MLSNRNSITTWLFLTCLVLLFYIIFQSNNCDLSSRSEYGMSFLQKPLENLKERVLGSNNSTNSPVETTGAPEKIQSSNLEEVDYEGYDEVLEGQSILSYYKKMGGTYEYSGGKFDGSPNLQLWTAYSYKDHYSAVLATPKKIGTKVYCRYIGKNGKEIGEPLESIVYPFYVVYCSRRNETTVLSITLRNNDAIDSKNSQILVRRRFKEYQHNVSFCLAPVYGNEPKWLHSVEMIEHYKLQGIKHFFIYIREIGEYDMKVFKSYEESGEVEIINVPPTNDDVIAQQLMGVADCLLRSRTHSKWSIFADIDERLIMADENNTIDQFMRSITDESIGSVAFPQRWIFKREQIPPKFINDAQVVEKMPTRAWHETTSPAMKGHESCSSQISCWAKDIVNNEKTIRMLVHEVKVFYPGYREIFLNATVGYIRHYRDVHMQSWEKNNIDNLKKLGSISNTSYPINLGSKLLNNVLARLHRVYKL